MEPNNSNDLSVIRELLIQSIENSVNRYVDPTQRNFVITEWAKLEYSTTFWQIRNADDVQSLWRILRRNELLFGTVMNATFMFMAAANIRLGDERSGEIFDIVGEWSEYMSFVPESPDVPTMVDEAWASSMSVEKGTLSGLYRLNPWMLLLLLMEATGSQIYNQKAFLARSVMEATSQEGGAKP